MTTKSKKKVTRVKPTFDMVEVTDKNVVELLGAKSAAAWFRPRPPRKSLRVGDHYTIVLVNGPDIFGEVLDPVATARYAMAHPSEGRNPLLLERYAPNLPHIHWSRAFSGKMPHGELDLVDDRTITRTISPEEFAEARAAGWRPPSRSKRSGRSRAPAP